MGKARTYWLAALTVFGGVVGGFISGAVVQRAPEVHATVPRAQARDYQIETAGGAAYIVDSSGNVFHVNSSGVKKIGQCK